MTAKNRRAHHVDEILWRGAIAVPSAVVQAALGAATLRTTHRHNVWRAEDFAGTVWVFRARPGERMLGEIVRTQAGGLRVHLWRGEAFADGLAVDVERFQVAAQPALILPSIPQPVPSWIEDRYHGPLKDLDD